MHPASDFDFTRAPPGRQLTLVTLLVVAVHAALLLGLPHWRLPARAEQDSATFVTRLIAPAPAPAVAQAPQPAPAPRVAAPAPQPQARPVAATRPAPAPAAQAARPDATSAPSETERRPTRADAGGAVDPQASELAPKPAVGFGGGSVQVPIEMPMTDEAASAAMRLALGMGDAPVGVPRAAEIGYQSSGKIGGEAFEVATTLYWRHDGRWYDARWTLYGPSIGEQTRRSTGVLTPQGLVPARAELRTPDAQEIQFDFDAQRVRFGATATQAPLQPGMQDRLGVMLQLAALMAGDPKRYPVGSAIELPAAHPRGPGRWRFVVEADEPVSALHGKTLPTVHLVHAAQDERDARIELWLGRTLDYLPVRLRITEANGDTAEHTVTNAYTLTVPTGPAPAR